MGKKLNILHVDDDADDVFFFEDAMAQAGVGEYSLQNQSNGEQALKYLLGKGDSGTLPNPDFVILDLNMGPLNGIETLEIIRKTPELSNLKIFILTCSELPGSHDECERLGVSGFYDKPSDLGALIDIIRAIVQNVKGVAL